MKNESVTKWRKVGKIRRKEIAELKGKKKDYEANEPQNIDKTFMVGSALNIHAGDFLPTFFALSLIGTVVDIPVGLYAYN